jgi:very-short-patch-repair endonuclease
MNTKKIIKQYTQDGLSCKEIADSLGTYSKKIERLLKKNGVELRTKSEAAKNAFKSGRSAPSIKKGEKRSESDKIAISIGMEKRWKAMPESQREQIKAEAKERWDKIPEEKRREMQVKAGQALRKTCTEGSKAEKSLKSKLEANGYEVQMHKKGLIQGNFEIDLLLPALNTIIEIDGPQHFLPIFGEERLAEVVKLDGIKNGLLLGKGFCVIRVKYLCNNFNKAVERRLWDLVSKAVANVEKKFPPKDKRFIELEIN